MLEPQIGRAKNQSARNSIEFDKRQRRRELIPGHEQDRATTEFPGPATEARAPGEIGQSDARIGIPEKTIGPVSC